MLNECRQLKAGPGERLRIALLNVDYVTSFELPFRLMLIRTPQLIAGLRDELQLIQKNVIFNGKRYACVWSLKSDLNNVPDVFQYRLVTRIRRECPEGTTAAAFQQMARDVKTPRERLIQIRIAARTHTGVGTSGQNCPVGVRRSQLGLKLCFKIGAIAAKLGEHPVLLNLGH